MRKYRTVLGLLLLLCILLNSAGCNLRTRYTVFSDESRTITHVSSAMRDYIGIVLESKEVLICDYKGHELCRKSFEKRIVNLDVFATTFLLQFEDNSVNVYHLEEHSMELKMREQFSSPIKKAEISGMWIEEAPILVVLLENGDLYSSKDLLLPEEIVKIDDHVKTEACLKDYFIYITDDNKVIQIRHGLIYEPAPDIESSVAYYISELKLARFDGDIGFLGIGANRYYYLSGIPLCLDSNIEISNVDLKSILSGKSRHYSVLYQIEGQWFYEGMTRDYKSRIIPKSRKRIKVEEGESVLPIPGGVIFYTDHEVRVRLI